MLVNAGQDFNITTSGGLLVFAQASFHVAYVDRLGDGRSNFAYGEAILADNLLSVLGASLTTGAVGFLANIRPPLGSGRAFLPKGNGLYTFDADELTGKKIEATFAIRPLESSPWPVESYVALYNLPLFFPANNTCTHVSPYECGWAKH